MTMINAQTEVVTPPDEPIVEVRRFLGAPPELVWRACCEPELLRRWWGPRRLENVECTIDLRAGGSWRVVQRAPDGGEFAFHGEYLELDPPSRRVSTWVYEGEPESQATETLVLEGVDGGTMLTLTSVHDSVAVRDLHVASGMEEGIVDSYARMDELIAELEA